LGIFGDAIFFGNIEAIYYGSLANLSRNELWLLLPGNLLGWLLAGVLQPDTGQLWLNGKPIETPSRRERAQCIVYLPQLNQVAWPLSVERLVELGRIPPLEPWQRPGPDDRIIIERADAYANEPVAPEESALTPFSLPWRRLPD
jgi:hypothetical protein